MDPTRGESGSIEDPCGVGNQWGALWVLAIGLGMIVLDGTIVGVAIPKIVTGLDLDITDAQWVNSIYSVVFAALLLSVGRVGDRVGRKRIFMAGTAIFVVGSISAALSDSSSALIWARVVQGVGGRWCSHPPFRQSTPRSGEAIGRRPSAFGVP